MGAIAAPAASTSSSCKRAKARTIAQNHVVRVFTVLDHSSDDKQKLLMACLKKTGRLRELAVAIEPEVINTYREFDLVRLRGRFVAFRLEDLPDCRYGCSPGADGVSQTLTSVDVRSGKCFAVTVAERPAGSRLLLDARGALAWPSSLPDNQLEVHALDAAGERVLDTGPIQPESLSLTRRGRLSWINNSTRTEQLTHSRAIRTCHS